MTDTKKKDSQASYLDQVPEEKPAGIPPFMMEYRRKYIAYSGEFQRTFGRRLFDFWDNLTGLDVILLDDFLQPPDGQSTESFIREKYGESAVELVRKLI